MDGWMDVRLADAMQSLFRSTYCPFSSPCKLDIVAASQVMRKKEVHKHVALGVLRAPCSVRSVRWAVVCSGTTLGCRVTPSSLTPVFPPRPAALESRSSSRESCAACLLSLSSLLGSGSDDRYAGQGRGLRGAADGWTPFDR